MSKIGVDIALAVKHLQNHGLVAIPTETVYGLAANALDSTAVARIFEAKNRPTFDPLIVHFGMASQIETYAITAYKHFETLASKFWPGPLTLLLQKKPLIPHLVTAGSPKVAVRIPNHSLTLELLRQLNFPLAAPSANPFGYISPTTALHVEQQLIGKVDYILDGGSCNVGLESTIVDLTGVQPIILRQGGLSQEEIEDCLNIKIEARLSSSNPTAPGMLASHYAPSVPLLMGNIEQLLHKNPHLRIGILGFNQSFTASNITVQLLLSVESDLHEAASHLFDYMRQLDQCDIDLILAQEVPNNGLGRAINDRLRRASAR